MKRFLVATVSAIALLAPAVAEAQDAGTVTKQKLSGAYTGKAYSPFAKRTFPERPLWGDNVPENRNFFSPSNPNRSASVCRAALSGASSKSVEFVSSARRSRSDVIGSLLDPVKFCRYAD